METISLPPPDLDDPTFQLIAQYFRWPIQLQQFTDYLRQNQSNNQEVPAPIVAGASRTPTYGIGSGGVAQNFQHCNCSQGSTATASDIYEMCRTQNYGFRAGTPQTPTYDIGSGSVAPNIPHCDYCQQSTATVTDSNIHEMCRTQSYGFHYSDSLDPTHLEEQIVVQDRTDDIRRGFRNNYHGPTFRGGLHNRDNRDLMHNRFRQPGRQHNWRSGPYLGRRSEPYPNLVDNFEPTLTDRNQINFIPVNPSQDYQQHLNDPAGLEWMDISREAILFIKKMEKDFSSYITSNSRNDQGLSLSEEDQHHPNNQVSPRPNDQVSFEAPNEQNIESLQDRYNIWHYPVNHDLESSLNLNDQEPFYAEEHQQYPNDQDSTRPSDHISISSEEELA
ncbi:unnamed protein product [Arctia plantaginis]|uniref:Uncharacterized protein n=1 Tax=Arctia plantaginis TaxID=874455 RepID=A0A8S0Z061_ARCPL|nr:unnamed protein product [Arctia plantaginis]